MATKSRTPAEINATATPSLREHELCTIFTLHAGEKFENEDMIVERVS